MSASEAAPPARDLEAEFVALRAAGQLPRQLSHQRYAARRREAKMQAKAAASATAAAAAAAQQQQEQQKEAASIRTANGFAGSSTVLPEDKKDTTKKKIRQNNKNNKPHPPCDVQPPHRQTHGQLQTCLSNNSTDVHNNNELHPAARHFKWSAVRPRRSHRRG